MRNKARGLAQNVGIWTRFLAAPNKVAERGISPCGPSKVAERVKVKVKTKTSSEKIF